jgi:lysosomal acid lipase/cholesteryl ester hydrolase
VDLGYDVWVGNSRGNPYTKHATLDPIADAKEYWDFSWAEMGLYDIPGVIDYIRALTY